LLSVTPPTIVGKLCPWRVGSFLNVAVEEGFDEYYLI
jgi:hypothetical protein